MNTHVQNLHCHRYELRSPLPLGALSTGVVRHGALLRVEFPNETLGYADLHPWTELGDLPLDAQLRALARGETTALSRASLAFASADANARAWQRSWWDGLSVPPSHFLLPLNALGGGGALDAALAEGFTRFKVKVGRDLDAEARSLQALRARLQSVSLADGGRPKLRLDYNETLSAAQCADYFAALAIPAGLLDFVEDPFPFDAQAWPALSARLGVPFAVDRAAFSPDALGFDGAHIYKPALAGPDLPLFAPAHCAHRRLVVTSYLDHPVGQLCAAWVAAHLPVAGPGETHGLASHRAYAPNAFSERLGWHGPWLTPPPGLGLGFDDLLGVLDWNPLP